jgi:ApbE superfamily uncharacterized protein (UPF0280 family)
MRDPATIRLLPDGRRLHLNDGPIDLIIDADSAPGEIRAAYQAAATRFVTILDELCAELPLLREGTTLVVPKSPAKNLGSADPGLQPRVRSVPEAAVSPLPTGPIARRMCDAVSPHRHRCFITPMAAVAGAVAEAVLAAMTEAADLARAYVNNGGDIALHLTTGQRFTIGMVERPDHPSLFGSMEICASMPVRGVATSGWRGRSFSLGIADAVTVLAEHAAGADAAATIIANAVDLPAHPAILRIPAREIAPDSDLLDLPVTRAVGPLSPQEIEQALDSGERVAQELRAQGLIHAAALCLQDHTRLVPVSNSLLRGSELQLRHQAARKTGLQPQRTSSPPHAFRAMNPSPSCGVQS